MTVRPASPSDADAIASVFLRGTPNHLRSLTLVGCSGYTAYVQEQLALQDRGGDHVYFVAEAEDQVVGAAEFRVVGSMWFLNNIHVVDAVRGSGIGRRLLQTGIEAGVGRPLSHFGLDVMADNVTARAWYGKLGLRAVGWYHWATLALPPLTDSGSGSVGGGAQAEVLLQAFGFAQVHVHTSTAQYPVGLLGERYYRLTSTALLHDADACAALRTYDSRRALLIISEVLDGMPDSAEVVGVSERMEAPLGVMQQQVNAFQR